MKRTVLYLLLISNSLMGQQREIQLYEGKPPGSERWTWKEQKNHENSVKVMTVYNVTQPSLTLYAPDPSAANGSAIIICPGGGFHFLAIDHEGTNIAKRFVEKGYIVFILKYRLVHVLTDNPFDEMLNAVDKKAWDDESLPVIPLAIADGRRAVEYVRENARAFNIKPDRIGILGFSAGGLVTAAAAFGYDESNRPDFVVPIYADIPESILDTVPTDAPPLFIACTQDDEFGFATHAIRLYNKWYSAGRPAELHLFERGGHGFGEGNPSNTTYHWIHQCIEWLKMNGFAE